MIVGVPTEVKTREYRVGMIPAGVRTLTLHGHKVLVQQGAGVGSGIPDEAYKAAGAEIVASADEVWKRADMIFKVKEPLPAGVRAHARGADHLHLPPPRRRARARPRCWSSARSPASPTRPSRSTTASCRCSQPMSAIAGRMVDPGRRDVPREGARRQGHPPRRRARRAARARRHHRRRRRRRNAARIAIGMGAEVTVLDVNIDDARPTSTTSTRGASTRSSPIPHNIEDGGAARRPRRRRGAGRRRARAAAGDRGDGRADGAGLGDRRRRRRPGRLHRDLPPDHARRPDLRGPRRRPLLRRQHAGRGGAHVDLRAQQRDAAPTACASPTWASPRRPRPIARSRGHQHLRGHVTHKAVAGAVNADFVPFTQL